MAYLHRALSRAGLTATEFFCGYACTPSNTTMTMKDRLTGCVKGPAGAGWKLGEVIVFERYCRVIARNAGGAVPGFDGVIREDVRDSTSDWRPYAEPQAAPGAPNVMFIVWDDMGFGAWDLYGGLVRMPNMRRLAEHGLRFTQFHTTALCSPTRASLLTGRNPQSVGMGTIGEASDGFPNLSCLIPADDAFLSEILSEQGYNTFAVGKWHLSPAAEMSMGSSKRTWPLSRGFDRFYGFLGGLTDQWYPDLTYDNHPVDPPALPSEGYHLSKDLADRAIEFIRDAKVTAAEKPWFTYFAPGAGHAPHHVFTEWADKYKGEFSMGYEKYREVVLANQIQLGVLPAGTELPPINPYEHATSGDGQQWPASDLVRPWDSLSDGEKQLFERQAEVFAGFASYTDAQVGRLLDYLEESGQFENTVFVVISDNGASAEGGPSGSVNENRWYNGVPENLDQNLALLGELGTESTHPHYSNGWAMAFNTPHKMYKINASFEGGVADPMIIAWPQGITARDEVRTAYLHVSDIVPTVLDLLSVDAPSAVKGYQQKPLEGVSFENVITDAAADGHKHEQFYCMMGTRGVWHNGWHASTVHPPAPAGWGHFDHDRWELFHLTEDRNQLRDLAAESPEKLAEMKQLWHELAGRYNGYPLDDRSPAEIFAIDRPNPMAGRTSMTLYPGGAVVPERSAVEIMGRSFTIAADLRIDGAAEGIIYSMGARFGGHAIFVQHGRLTYVYNWLGEDEQVFTAPDPLPDGAVRIGVRYVIEGRDGTTPHGTTELYVDDVVVASGPMKSQPAYFTLAGEGATVGREVGQPVSSRYIPPFTFTGGTIDRVVVDVSGEDYSRTETLLRGMYARD
ncbi:arylsulfatase [Leifsonia sp. YIM 134122]|uniref:Arylsulfatase n=1 Tax=Leifsonia stereocauli TaxID=3134136 RepID=A0ABU9W191_9MICO